MEFASEIERSQQEQPWGPFKKDLTFDGNLGCEHSSLLERTVDFASEIEKSQEEQTWSLFKKYLTFDSKLGTTSVHTTTLEEKKQPKKK